jgi:hypothetical protein
MSDGFLLGACPQQFLLVGCTIYDNDSDVWQLSQVDAIFASFVRVRRIGIMLANRVLLSP